MTRDSARSHAVRAFVDYAARGYPSISDAELYPSGELRSDILAVARMFARLDREGKEHIALAVRDVYMFASPISYARRRTSERVVSHAMRAYADVRTVWRWLSYARQVFAELRADEEP